MQKSISGRLDRPHYWLILVAAIVTKALLKAAVGGSLAGNISYGLDIVILCAIIARLHDVGLPTWVGVSGWIALVVLQIFVMVQDGNAMPAWAGFVGLAFFAFVGTLRGQARPNAFGPPDQGFRGLNRLEGSAATPN